MINALLYRSAPIVLAFFLIRSNGPACAQFGQPQRFAPEDWGPVHVEAADLDGDGDVDIVSSLTFDGRVVWYANDGAGQFGPAEAVLEGIAHPRWSSTADIDSDGDRDVIVAYGNSGVFLWVPNMGAGVFAEPIVITTGQSAPWTLDTGDIDLDGDLDIALSFSTGPIRWFSNNGDGTLWTEHLLGLTGSGGTLELADVDGDGDIDLLSAEDFSQPTISWFRNEGAGTFSPRLTLYDGPSHGRGVRASDADLDGDLDIVFIGSFPHVIGLIENLGNQEFSDPSILLSGPEPFSDLLVDDVDGDGSADLVVSTFWSDEVLFMKSAGGGEFYSPVVLSNEQDGGATPSAVDIDADGDKDILFVSDSDGEIKWVEQTTGGVFASPPHVVVWALDAPNAIDAADLDGDGDADAFSASSNNGDVVMYVNDGVGRFDAPVLLFRTEPLVAPLLTSDRDQDGDMDLISGSILGTVVSHLNDGSGTFVPQPWITGDTAIVAMELTDMNNDGLEDLLYATSTGPGKIKWLTGNGSGTFSLAHAVDTLPLPAWTIDFFAIDAGDIDGDGDQDILSSGPPHDLFWYANNGSGDLGPRILIADSVNEADHVQLIDIDLDDDLDAFFIRQPVMVHDGEAPMAGLPRVAWYPNNGDGTFGEEVPVLHAWSTCRMELLDVDGDGDTDVWVAASNDSGHQRCLINDGEGGFSVLSNVPGQYPSSSFGKADIDGDGDVDLLATKVDLDALYTMENYFGSPFRIEGRVFLDLDSDGSFSLGDTTAQFIAVTLSTDGAMAFSDHNGRYQFFTDVGQHSVGSSINSSLWALTTGVQEYAMEITDQDPVSVGNDFGYTPLVDTTILVPSMNRAGGVCGDTVSMWLSWLNQGTRIEQGVVRFDLDTIYSIFSSYPEPDSISGNTYFWYFDSLFYHAMGGVYLELVLPGVDHIGHAENTQLTVFRMDPQGGVTAEFSALQNGIVTCAYDPNDKMVLPAGYGEFGAIPVDHDVLEYTIRFQNTGNDTAMTVILRDRLNERLDPGSLSIISVSHRLTHAAIEGDGEAVFRFDEILLPDSSRDAAASQGYIKFRIAIRPGLGHLTVIENQASIFFDLNPPIITNTVRNTLVDCNLWDPAIDPLGSELLEATSGDAYQWLLDGVPLDGGTERTLFITAAGNYEVEVTSNYGCAAVTPPFQVIATTVEEEHELRFAVVPNPLTTTARIVFDRSISRDHAVDIVDVNGKVLRTIPGNEGNELPVERNGLAPGIYLLRLFVSGSLLASRRIAVE